MNKQKKAYLVLTCLFLVISLIILTVESLSFISIADIQASVSEEAYRLEKLAEEKSNLTILSQRYEKIEDETAKVNIALPDEKDTSKLVSDLDSLAVDAGLKLTLVQSSNIGKKQTGIADPSLLQTVKGQFGYELPLDISVTGPYQNLTSFIKMLENYQRLVNVSAVEINKVTDNDAPSDQIEAKLKLTAYLKK